MNETYFDSKQLAERYGITENTIRRWRLKSKKQNKQIGPKWYEIPKQATSPQIPRVRYSLDQLITWEEENKITPKNIF